MKMNDVQRESTFQRQLDDYSLEDILEMYDLSPMEVLLILFNAGHIKDENIEDIKEC